MTKTLNVYFSSTDVKPCEVQQFVCWERLSVDIGDEGNGLSLLAYIEQNGDRLKSDFAAYICSFQKHVFNSKGVKTENDIVWNLSRFCELANHDKSPNVDILFKLFSLEVLINEVDAESVCFIGFPCDLTPIIKSMASSATVKDESTEKVILSPSTFLNRFIKSMAYSMLTLLLIAVRSIFSAQIKYTSNSDVVIVDYLYEFDSSDQVNYKSKYWGELPSILRKQGYSISWFHIFVSHRATESLASARQAIHGLSTDSHYLVEDFQTLKGAFRSLKTQLKFWYLLSRRRQLLDNTPPDYYWPLFVHDWVRSFESVELFRNLMFKESFRAAIPKAKSGATLIYICENQPWEYALCNEALFKNYDNIVASLQATVRYWDFRYLHNLQRSHFINSAQALAPHIIACSSEDQEKLLLGSTSALLHQVEAYRMGKEHDVTLKQNDDDLKIVVVAGEYSDVRTLNLFDLIRNIDQCVLECFKLYYRSHPSSTLDIPPDLQNKICDEPEGFDYRKANAIISDANTSFAADCWEYGLNLYCLLASDSLNMSPVYNKQNVKFFSGSRELESFFRDFEQRSSHFKPASSLFNSSKGAGMWLSIIENGV